MRIPHGLRAAAGAGGGGPWEVAGATFKGTPVNFFFVGAQDTAPQGLAFKADGTKFYIAGDTSNSIFQYDLSIAWDVSSASYIQSFSVSAQDTQPLAIAFKSDGTEMYVTGGATDSIIQYSLSTSWDLSSASFTASFSVSSQTTAPQGLFFKSDGTQMYLTETATGSVLEYALSTAWDISSTSYTRQKITNTQDAVPTGVSFKNDGTVMLITGGQFDAIYEYLLGAPWDISSASYVQNFSVASQATSPNDLFVKGDGSEVYIVGSASDSVWSYQLSTPWDVSTASFSYPATDYLNTKASLAAPAGLTFKPDGTIAYTVNPNNRIAQYALSSAWDLSTASLTQSVNVTTDAEYGIAFKTDGTVMFVVSQTNARIEQLSLSVAWDVSTATSAAFFSVVATPQDIYFRDDGLKFYIVSSNTDKVHEYDAGSAWSISGSTLVQDFSVASQDNLPTAVFFKDDGTKMYVVGATTDAVYQYELSTAWDISTSVYSEDFSVVRYGGSPNSISFKDDGTIMFVGDTLLNAVLAYTL